MRNLRAKGGEDEMTDQEHGICVIVIRSRHPITTMNFRQENPGGSRCIQGEGATGRHSLQ